jgi:two-component system response regulator
MNTPSAIRRAERPILLVDDSTRDAELLTDAIDTATQESSIASGVLAMVRVDHVRDGVDALGYLGADGAFAGRFGALPALIVLDLKMPRMNGMELLAALKADVRFRHIPVMLMTSSEQPEDIAAAYRLGVNAYVRKPLLFDDLVSTMRHVLGFWLDVNLLPTGDVA